LRGLGQRASQVQILLKLAPWSTVKEPEKIWSISLAVPQGSCAGLMPILRERLSYYFTYESFMAPARSLQFSILDSVPSQGTQRDFFHSKEIEEENRDQLMGRLISQLGEGYIFYGIPIEKYRPEESWSRELIMKKKEGMGELSKPIPHRPSRILNCPEAIQLRPSLILHPSGKNWRIRFWKGPERISTEWWKEPETTKVDRDYYEVTTSDYEKLWIFFDRTMNPKQAFLHGYFD
jgi:hypothetical protein